MGAWGPAGVGAGGVGLFLRNETVSLRATIRAKQSHFPSFRKSRDRCDYPESSAFETGIQKARGQGVVAEKCEKRELTLRFAPGKEAGLPGRPVTA